MTVADVVVQLALIAAAVSGAYFMTGILVADIWCQNNYAFTAGAVFWPLLVAVVLPYVVTRWFINLKIWDSHYDPE